MMIIDEINHRYYMFRMLSGHYVCIIIVSVYSVNQPIVQSSTLFSVHFLEPQKSCGCAKCFFAEWITNHKTNVGVELIYYANTGL